MQTFVVKLASGVAALVASICLTVCNLSQNTDGAAVAAAGSSVAGLRLTMTVFPIAGLLVAVFYFRKKYILSEQKVEEIAKEIKEMKKHDHSRKPVIFPAYQTYFLSVPCHGNRTFGALILWKKNSSSHRRIDGTACICAGQYQYL